MDYREILKRYNFRKPKREVNPSEQIDLISIFDFEEKKHKDNSQQQQKLPLHQQKHVKDQIPQEIQIPNKKCKKRINRQTMVGNMCGKKVQNDQDDEVRYVFIPR